MELSNSLSSVMKEALDGLNNLIFAECSLSQDVRGGREEKEQMCRGSTGTSAHLPQGPFSSSGEKLK